MKVLTFHRCHPHHCPDLHHLLPGDYCVLGRSRNDKTDQYEATSYWFEGDPSNTVCDFV